MPGVPQHNMLDDDEMLPMQDLSEGNIHQEHDYGTIKRENPNYDNNSQLIDLSETSQIQTNAVDENQQLPLELLIKGKREKLTDEEIQKLIDDNYLEECSSTATGNA